MSTLRESFALELRLLDERGVELEPGRKTAVSSFQATGKLGKIITDHERGRERIAKGTPVDQRVVALRELKATTVEAITSWQKVTFPKLDAAIEQALPEPERPAVRESAFALVAAKLDEVDPVGLSQFYLTASPEVAAVLEQLPDRIEVKNGVPLSSPRLRPEDRARRRYRDAPEAARAKHDGLRSIRVALQGLSGAALDALKTER